MNFLTVNGINFTIFKLKLSNYTLAVQHTDFNLYYTRLFCKELCGDQCGEFICGYWDLKEFTGLTLFFTYIFKNRIKVEQQSSGGLREHSAVFSCIEMR